MAVRHASSIGQPGAARWRLVGVAAIVLGLAIAVATGGCGTSSSVHVVSGSTASGPGRSGSGSASGASGANVPLDSQTIAQIEADLNAIDQSLSEASSDLNGSTGN
jgi:hypothetical protein